MRRLYIWPLVVVLAALGATESYAQDQSSGQADPQLSDQQVAQQPSPAPDKGAQKPAPTPAPAAPAPTPPSDELALASPTASRLQVTRSAFLTSPAMMGDQLGIPGIAFGRRGNPQFPPLPGNLKGAILVPTIRGFKVAEDEAPAPQDRIYFGFNYWDNVNAAVNRELGTDLRSLRAYRETFGVEKTFLDGDMSVGLRLPLDTLTGKSDIPGLGGDSTDIGDLSIIMKFALLSDRETGNILSAGLAVTVPTGPNTFGGFPNVTSFHETTLQPFVGYRLGWGDFFVHGFTSVDVPTDGNDVTMLFNDIGIGYSAYRNRDEDAIVRAIIPTFEVHVNTPLNHRGALNFNDLAGTADTVDLTFGATFELGQCSTLAVAFVTPVTGPRPFDYEILAQLNIRFGARGLNNYGSGAPRVLE